MPPPNFKILTSDDSESAEPLSYSELRFQHDQVLGESDWNKYFQSLDRPTQEAWTILKMFTDRVGFEEWWDHEEVDDWARDNLFDEIRDRMSLHL
ncbi:hypothetical protein [Pelagicoccus sp. SDUM812003]|uniref:hypothetical protein n=1 Tax=Pelagicoccus sp. SDUM812003 TaxID=3041267 RepID=UPI00280E5228|nr:hypothetical protein [Pelagicoccus sp. SDUM812003]MDQ8203349.1 hypothetical protein [Pelagicoccus sp. SDUM812003]